MLKLAVIVVSTRPGRAGEPVGRWFEKLAREHGKFDVEWVDLKEVNLPLFNESKHPRFGEYEHEHTRTWSARVKPMDAFVFVTPEYNYAAPPSVINAIDYLSAEWRHKVAGFVSYGGVSGGTRSVQMSKQVLTSVGIMPIPEAVAVPFVHQHIKDGTFGGAGQENAAAAMLDELHRWAQALKSLRT